MVLWVPLKGRRVLLHLEGVDSAAEVFVNGELVGAHEGIFTAPELVVTGRFRTGANLARFSDGHFDLAPGEQRRVEVRWRATSNGGRRVAVRSWNSPEVVVA